jgi:hypothetical protein
LTRGIQRTSKTAASAKIAAIIVQPTRDTSNREHGSPIAIPSSAPASPSFPDSSILK